MKKRIMSQMKTAMKSGQKNVVGVLRMIIADIQKEEIDLKKELTNEDVVKIIKKGIKSREESLRMYIEGNRSDLAKKEEEEIKVLVDYLPKQFSEDETEELVVKIVAELDLTSKKDIGKLMKEVLGRYGAHVDGRTVLTLAQKTLQ
ncbi:MAG: GatB/YqeY domain-containing protein [Candidatus Ancaeobacter aquaticus]|nr:GatB/YqeY domain-containing protein [Candidatus Ancaeobacter aquaticus]